MPYKLAINMVPTPLQGQNLRRHLTQWRWRKIRQALIDERGLKCQTCCKVEIESKRIAAHEEWKYVIKDASCLASLVGLKLVCWHCHHVEHFGATRNMVRSGELSERAIEDTIKHFCRVNRVSREAFDQHWTESIEKGARFAGVTDWYIHFGTYTALVEETRRARAARKEMAKYTSKYAGNVESTGVDFDGDGPPVRYAKRYGRWQSNGSIYRRRRPEK